jgi:hypothetical protein
MGNRYGGVSTEFYLGRVGGEIWRANRTDTFARTVNLTGKA